MTRLLSAVLVVAPLAAHAAADPVVLWNANAGLAATKACMEADQTRDPFHESRMYAMMHIAIHDAINAINPKYHPYAYSKKAEVQASPDAAIAAAARDVLETAIDELPTYIFSQACIDAGSRSVKASYEAAINSIPETPARREGIIIGREAAAMILAQRAGDYANGQFINKHCPKPEPGKYQCTPKSDGIYFQDWATVTPFTLKNAAQFRPGPPYPINDPKFADDLDEVKRLGGDGNITPHGRTEDQTQMALFWAENAPSKWNRIARTVSSEKKLSTVDNARLFALLNMALADGLIAAMDAKNHYDFWRPVTAIRERADKSWTPLLPTPPDQEYPSSHAIEGGAAAAVLTAFFGTDQMTFVDCGMKLPANRCDDPNPVLRTYTSFTQAADENAYAGVLVGFHFLHSVEEGTVTGRKIGEQAAMMLQAR